MPVTATSRQGRAYRREEIEQLLRVALAELTADGTAFRDLSVDRMVSAAGMARSTFYKYFEDKTTMLEVLSAGTLKRLYADQRSWLTKGREITRDDVYAGMRPLFTHYVEEQAVMRAVAEAAIYDEPIREAYLRGVHDYARAIERLIRRGQNERWIGPVDPAGTATALAWMTERTVSQEAPGAGAKRLDRLAEGLTAVVWVTLFPGRAATDGAG